MRRPVKPFVTEYKGSSRRGKEARPETEEVKPQVAEGRSGKVASEPPAGTFGRSSGKPSGRAAAKQESEARGSLPPRGLFRNGPPEDEPINSYEAAMRAADALFSPKAKAEPATSDRPPATPAAMPQATAQAPEKHADCQPEATGRVLRALDEPEPALPEPLPEPRRRGRKPGSVNRPRAPGVEAPGDKVGGIGRAGASAQRLVEAPPTAPLDLEGEDFYASEPSMSEPAARVSPRRAEQHLDEEVRPEQDSTERDATAAQTANGTPAVARPNPKRQRDRFPWIKTKLSPGERWKRRLPKVAW